MQREGSYTMRISCATINVYLVSCYRLSIPDEFAYARMSPGPSAAQQGVKVSIKGYRRLPPTRMTQTFVPCHTADQHDRVLESMRKLNSTSEKAVDHHAPKHIEHRLCLVPLQPHACQPRTLGCAGSQRP